MNSDNFYWFIINLLLIVALFLMGMRSLPVFLFIGLFGFIPLLIERIYINYRKNKGTVTISVQKQPFYKGEKICGNVKVLLKKQFPIKNVKIRLICRKMENPVLIGEPRLQRFDEYSKAYYIEDTFSVGITKSIPFELSHPYDTSTECEGEDPWRRGLFKPSSGPVQVQWGGVWLIAVDLETTKKSVLNTNTRIDIKTYSETDMME